MHPDSIKITVLQKLPYGGRFVEFKEVHTMDKVKKLAIVWVWIDRHGQSRLSYFDPENGDYLGDGIIQRQ